jgi:hypothetical protein
MHYKNIATQIEETKIKFLFVLSILSWAGGVSDP